MSHWQPFMGGFVHVSTTEAPPRIRNARLKNKRSKRLATLLSARVNLGPVLVGEFKMRRALARGRSYAKSK